MATINDIQDQLIEEITMFDEWLDRYTYIIDMGKELPEPDPALLCDRYKIDGCQSNVWIDACMQGDKIHFSAYSDALLIKGIVAMLLRVLNDRTPREILDADLYFIDRTGLSQHLSPNRSNGILAMLRQMKEYAMVFNAKQKS